jgi:hypothetical protein
MYSPLRPWVAILYQLCAFLSLQSCPASFKFIYRHLEKIQQSVISMIMNTYNHIHTRRVIEVAHNVQIHNFSFLFSK